MINILTGVMRQLIRHKWRTVMIALTVTVGVMAVAIIDIVGDAGIVKFNKELDCLGISGISVTVNTKSGVAPLDSRDVNTISGIDNVESAMGIIKSKGSVKGYGDDIGVSIMGIGENAKDTISLEMKYGRYIDKVDIMSYSAVCLIDDSLSIDLFGSDNSVGRQVDIKSSSFSGTYEIVGVIPTEGSIIRNVAEDMMKSSVYIPYSIMGDDFSSVAVTVKDSTASDTTANEIKRIIGYDKGNRGAVNANDMAVQRDRINRLLDIIKQLLTVIGATSIVVSSLSIMTIMLLTVKERTYEIGIKKSIGASNGRILAEFICESGVVALIGGVVGVILSLIVSVVIALVLGMTVIIHPDKAYRVNSYILFGRLYFGGISCTDSGKTQSRRRIGQKLTIKFAYLIDFRVPL